MLKATIDPALPGCEWVQVGATTKRRYTVTELEPGTLCWFQVKAVNAAGTGPASETGMARAAF